MDKEKVFKDEMVPLIDKLLEISRREKMPFLMGVALGRDGDRQALCIAHECLEISEDGAHLRMVKSLMDVTSKEDLKECVVKLLRGAGALAIRLEMPFGEDADTSLDKVKEMLDAIKGAGDATRH